MDNISNLKITGQIITIDKILRIFCFSFIKIPPLVCTFLFKLIIIQIKNSVKYKIKNWTAKMTVQN